MKPSAFDHRGLPIASYFHDVWGRDLGDPLPRAPDAAGPQPSRHREVAVAHEALTGLVAGVEDLDGAPGRLGLSGPWYQNTSHTCSGVASTTNEKWCSCMAGSVVSVSKPPAPPLP